jgi:hypothetical protein
MTRKFLYDSRTGRLRALDEDAEAPVAPRWGRPLRWFLVALVIGASALAFNAAHAVAQARNHAISAR